MDFLSLEGLLWLLWFWVVFSSFSSSAAAVFLWRSAAANIQRNFLSLKDTVCSPLWRTSLSF